MEALGRGQWVFGCLAIATAEKKPCLPGATTQVWAGQRQTVALPAGCRPCEEYPGICLLCPMASGVRGPARMRQTALVMD